MKKIYILLSRTNTVPARIIRAVAGGTYSHVSLALIPDTGCFYSYARRKLKNPLCAGLVTENIHTQVFAMYPEAPVELYQLSISDEAYAKIREALSYFLSHYEEATYNFLGMLLLALGIRLKRKYKFTCSQFVALLLSDTKEITLPKDPYLMLPNDFRKIEKMELIYKGPLKTCSFENSLPFHSCKHKVIKV